jgi:Tol biopolymer transport system component
LPVFSPDGEKLMWTSTRDGHQPAQLFIADFVPPKED